MRTENKSKWMTWTIIFLVVLNLATIITVVYNRNNLSRVETGLKQNQYTPENVSMKYSGRYFRDSLGLSMEQMKKFSEFNPGFRQSVMAINRSMAEKRHEMLIEMADQECDTNRLNILADSIGYLHASLKKQTYLYYLNFKNICNEPQQEKLQQLFGEMFNNDIQLGQNEKNGPIGRRFGWRNDN